MMVVSYLMRSMSDSRRMARPAARYTRLSFPRNGRSISRARDRPPKAGARRRRGGRFQPRRAESTNHGSRRDTDNAGPDPSAYSTLPAKKRRRERRRCATTCCMPQVQRNGVKLHYVDVGPRRRGRRLAPCLPSQWRDVPAAGAGASVSQVPLLGSGSERLRTERDAPEGPTEMSLLAEDALSILDAAKVKTAVVCGVSLGGYVALASLRHDAGRVRGLVLADTHPYADDDEAGKQEGARRRRSWSWTKGWGPWRTRCCPSWSRRTLPPPS